MFNQIIIVGNVGKDAEVKTLQGGLEVATFSVATTHSFKKGDTWEKETTWHKVIAFGNRAKFASDLKKGQKVTVVGRQANREYEDRTGQKKYSSEINAENIFFDKNEEF